jgi:hypothetical protein
MGNKQQTAITFLIEQIDKLEEEDGYLDIDKFFWLKQDALQMEREQIEQAFIKGNEFVPKWKINGVPYIESEQYYEQTYGTPKSR